MNRLDGTIGTLNEQKLQVSHDLGTLISEQFITHLMTHKGYRLSKNLDANTFLYAKPSTNEQVLVFIGAPNEKITFMRAQSVENRIKLHLRSLRRKMEVIIIARRFENSAKTHLWMQGKWHIYSARDLRIKARQLIVNEPMSIDPYKSIRWGLSPPTYNAIRIIAGLLLLMTAMVPAMLLGAWENNYFLLAYPVFLTLVVGGFVTFYTWQKDLEWRAAILLLVIYSVVLNIATKFIIPTFMSS